MSVRSAASVLSSKSQVHNARLGLWRIWTSPIVRSARCSRGLSAYGIPHHPGAQALMSSRGWAARRGLSKTAGSGRRTDPLEDLRGIPAANPHLERLVYPQPSFAGNRERS